MVGYATKLKSFLPFEMEYMLARIDHPTYPPLLRPLRIVGPWWWGIGTECIVCED